MNKVITINLNGVAYQLEEGGYEALREYLDNAARRLEGNPDKDEIIADIEQAIADKFRALLGAHKTVVVTKEVTAVISEMGPVEDANMDEPAAGAGASPGGGKNAAQAGDGGCAPPPVRRVYRIHEGAMISGVCNGLGVYFAVNPTFIRLGFVVLTFLWGVGILVYVLMSLVVPAANTPAEKAAASGAAATTQEFIRRAKAGYYEGMKNFHDKQSRREWKRKFKRDMQGWAHGFQREMQEHAHHWTPPWQHNWQQNWPQHPPSIFGAVFIAPVLSLLLLGLLLAMFYAIYTLVTAHAVLGVTLPAGMPLWVEILLTVFLFQLIAWPIKSARFSCYYPGGYYRHGGPWGALFGLIGMFFLAFGIWSLDRHVPEFHEWLEQLPVMLQQFFDTVSSWFTRR